MNRVSENAVDNSEDALPEETTPTLSSSSTPTEFREFLANRRSNKMSSRLSQDHQQKQVN